MYTGGAHSNETSNSSGGPSGSACITSGSCANGTAHRSDVRGSLPGRKRRKLRCGRDVRVVTYVIVLTPFPVQRAVPPEPFLEHLGEPQLESDKKDERGAFVSSSARDRERNSVPKGRYMRAHVLGIADDPPPGRRRRPRTAAAGRSRCGVPARPPPLGGPAGTR